MEDAALRCRVCETVTSSRLAEQCDRCDGPLDVAYDWNEIRSTVSRDEIAAGPASLWRYAPLLPVSPDGHGLPAGWTPLIHADRLSSLLGIELWLKLETANPTQSFKDRIAAIAGATTARLGLQTICCSSSGHLGDAIAAEAAARGLEAVILAPAEAPLVSSEVYGAHLVGLDCSFDACHLLERELSELFPWAFLEGNIEAYAAEGAKTIAFELVEQLGWHAPDAVVCPIGSGRLFAKAAQGMAELDRLGWLEGAAAAPVRRAGRGVQPGRGGVRRRPPDLRRRVDHVRQLPGRRPAERGRSRDRRGPGERRRHSQRPRGADREPPASARRDHGHLRGRRRRRRRGRALRSGARRDHRDRRDRRPGHHRHGLRDDGRRGPARR